MLRHSGDGKMNDVDIANGEGTGTTLKKDAHDTPRGRGPRPTATEMSADEEREVMECFQCLDEQGKGAIDWAHFAKAADIVLGPGKYNLNALKRACQELDFNRSGLITWAEFQAYVSANWSASKTADFVLHAQARDMEDMLTIDGHLRVVDLCKHYRRKVLMDRVCKGQGLDLGRPRYYDDGYYQPPGADSGDPPVTSPTAPSYARGFDRQPSNRGSSYGSPRRAVPNTAYSLSGFSSSSAADGEAGQSPPLSPTALGTGLGTVMGTPRGSGTGVALRLPSTQQPWRNSMRGASSSGVVRASASGSTTYASEGLVRELSVSLHRRRWTSEAQTVGAPTVGDAGLVAPVQSGLPAALERSSGSNPSGGVSSSGVGAAGGDEAAAPAPPSPVPASPSRLGAASVDQDDVISQRITRGLGPANGIITSRRYRHSGSMEVVAEVPLPSLQQPQLQPQPPPQQQQLWPSLQSPRTSRPSGLRPPALELSADGGSSQSQQGAGLPQLMPSPRSTTSPQQQPQQQLSWLTGSSRTISLRPRLSLSGPATSPVAAGSEQSPKARTSSSGAAAKLPQLLVGSSGRLDVSMSMSRGARAPGSGSPAQDTLAVGGMAMGKGMLASAAMP